MSARTCAGLWRRRRQVLLGHALQHADEDGDEPVDVALVVGARRLQDHQRAEQLRRRARRRPDDVNTTTLRIGN